MGDEAWFATDSMPPPLRVRVRISWAGREFEAVRLVHPKKKRILWATIIDGEAVYLPPKGRNKIWGEHPQLWQPVDMATWEHALPEPQRLAIPNWPRPQEIVSRETSSWDGMWWRDVTLIAYSSSGEISRREAEGRLMRALNTNLRIKVERPGFQSCSDVLARLSQEKMDLETDEPLGHDWRPPFEPLGVDLDDFLTAMAWFRALNPREMWHKRRRFGDMNRAQAVLLYRSLDPPASWDFIGRKWGVSGERVRQIYKSSLDKIERAANGRPVFKHVRVTDPMIEVRERNRRATQSSP